MHTMLDRAQGVFLGVRQLVENLRQFLTNGQALSIDDLGKKMDQTLGKLRDFFAFILGRIAPDSRLESYVVFQCAVRAQQPLSSIDLWLMLRFYEKIDTPNSLEEPLSLSVSDS